MSGGGGRRRGVDGGWEALTPLLSPNGSLPSHQLNLLRPVEFVLHQLITSAIKAKLSSKTAPTHRFRPIILCSR